MQVEELTFFSPGGKFKRSLIWPFRAFGFKVVQLSAMVIPANLAPKAGTSLGLNHLLGPSAGNPGSRIKFFKREKVHAVELWLNMDFFKP